MHNRLSPEKNSFHYRVFLFCIDLDELDELSKRFWLFSRNRFNMFTFRDKDYMELREGHPSKNATIKEKITSYLKENNIDLGNGTVKLITNARTLGHLFNPVSFYYCYKENGDPLCAIVEVTNTFYEMKRYILTEEQLQNGNYKLNTTKYFYVSPFVALDTNFDFNLHPLTNKLNVRIDDIDREGNRFFISTLTGFQQKITNLRLLWYALSFPLITVKVITLIHWQALILWLKKVPFHSKNANLHLQQEVLKPYKE